MFRHGSEETTPGQSLRSSADDAGTQLEQRAVRRNPGGPAATLGAWRRIRLVNSPSLVRSPLRRGAAFAIVVCSALLCGAVAGVEAEAKPPAEFYGVVPSEAVSPEDLAAMSESGVRTLRFMFFWPAIEESPGSFDWSAHDQLVRSAAENDIRIFPMLFGTPGWANLLAGRNSCGSICAPHADVTRNGFANFAKAAAERYGPGGDFWTASGGECGIPELCPLEGAPCECVNPLPITTWQLWNEQNSPKYYRPGPSPQEYAKLIRAASSSIRGVDPAADIVLGGMWGPPGTDSVLPTVEYLEQLYSVPGIEGSFDSIAVHPYAPTISGVKDQMMRVRSAVRRAGDAGVGTWITEIGWASGGPKNGLVKTPKAQARLLRESFTYLIRKRRAWHIRGLTWYAWNDVTASQSDCAWCPKAGLRARSGAEKPAGRAYRQLALGP